MFPGFLDSDHTHFPLYFTLRCLSGRGGKTLWRIIDDCPRKTKRWLWSRFHFSRQSCMKSAIFRPFFTQTRRAMISAWQLLKTPFKESRWMLACKDGIASSFLTQDNIHSYSFVLLFFLMQSKVGALHLDDILLPLLGFICGVEPAFFFSNERPTNGSWLFVKVLLLSFYCLFVCV